MGEILRGGLGTSLVDIKNPKDLEAQLKQQPKRWSQIIALRTALHV